MMLLHGQNALAMTMQNSSWLYDKTTGNNGYNVLSSTSSDGQFQQNFVNEANTNEYNRTKQTRRDWMSLYYDSVVFAVGSVALSLALSLSLQSHSMVAGHSSLRLGTSLTIATTDTPQIYIACEQRKQKKKGITVKLLCRIQSFPHCVVSYRILIWI